MPLTMGQIGSCRVSGLQTQLADGPVQLACQLCKLLAGGGRFEGLADRLLGDVADAVADRWWEVEIARGWSGTGVDNACGTAGPHVADMEDAAPRLVRISRRP